MKLRKIITLLLFVIIAGPRKPYAASPITDHHELTSLGSGVYQINFNSGSKWRGFVTGDNSTLNRKWYCRYEIQFASNWDWGSSTYDGTNPYLSNCKIIRFWNPSDSITENVVIALMGWENNAMLSVENIGEQNYRFLPGFKSILKAGTTHLWEFEFFESDVNQSNGYMKVWLNGNLVLDQGGLMTRKAWSALKRPYNGGGIENVWTKGPYNGDNTMTLSKVVMEPGKTRAEYLGGTPAPTTTVTPKPTATVTIPPPNPSPLPTISGTATPQPPLPDPSIMPEWFINWVKNLQAFLGKSIEPEEIP